MKSKSTKDKLTLAVAVASVIFAVLTIAASVLIIRSGGTINAGYAVVPCCFAVMCAAIVSGWRNSKKDGGKNDNDNNYNE